MGILQTCDLVWRTWKGGSELGLSKKENSGWDERDAGKRKMI